MTREENLNKLTDMARGLDSLAKTYLWACVHAHKLSDERLAMVVEDLESLHTASNVIADKRKEILKQKEDSK
jgi:hypothetical protein